MFNRLQEKLIPRLPLLLVILCIMQPVLDVLSYWQDKLGFGNTLTLILRFGVLVAVALLGFIVAPKKLPYYIFAACCAALLLGHCYACSVKGYLDIVSDLTNFVRVAQMPLFALCFISFLQRNEQCYRALERGLMLSFAVISAVFVLSVVTGSYQHTYDYSQVGIIGWFGTGNAQSAVLSLLTPIAVMLAHKSGKLWPVILAVAAAFAQLYFIGTRLGFLAMAATTVGIPFTLIITRRPWKKTTLVLAVAMLICCATVKQSPMYINQTLYSADMYSKQGDALSMLNREFGEYIDIYRLDWDSLSEEDLSTVLRIVYNYYQTALVDRFGLEPVLKAYDYSHDVMTITGTRYRKIVFCRLLLTEHEPISKLFGMELGRMNYDGVIYDVENDFHGIFFLYGWVGLAMMLAFILYFIRLIVLALIKDARKYYTIEAGAFGIAFCLALAYAYNTSGVLRRPNSSFYLSLIVAVILYLVKLRKYPTQNAADPAAVPAEQVPQAKQA